MESKYLVESTKESTGSSNLLIYGAVNSGCDAGNEKCSNGATKIEKSFEANQSSLKKSCACPNDVPCDCGLKKKNITFEPWARYKTITMAVGLSLFGLWIIIIAIVAKQGKL